jgi:hypothetical protein
MSHIVEAVAKTKQGIMFDGAWHNCTTTVGNFVKKGDVLESFQVDGRGQITRVQKAQGAGGGGYRQQSQGGAKSGTPAQDTGKKPYVDNTLGMAVGAALNNAVSLVVAGVITEDQIPYAVGSLYTFSEKAKKLISEGKIAELASMGFSLKAKHSAKPQAPVVAQPPVFEAEEEEEAPEMPSAFDADDNPFG